MLRYSLLCCCFGYSQQMQIQCSCEKCNSIRITIILTIMSVTLSMITIMMRDIKLTFFIQLCLILPCYNVSDHFFFFNQQTASQQITLRCSESPHLKARFNVVLLLAIIVFLGPTQILGLVILKTFLCHVYRKRMFTSSKQNRNERGLSIYTRKNI